MLHLVNYKFTGVNDVKRCFERFTVGDTVVFIESGVFSLRAGYGTASEIESVLDNINIAALEPDLAARGIAEVELIRGVQVIDYAKFVDLAVELSPVNSWFGT